MIVGITMPVIIMIVDVKGRAMLIISDEVICVSNCCDKC